MGAAERAKGEWPYACFYHAGNAHIKCTVYFKAYEALLLFKLLKGLWPKLNVPLLYIDFNNNSF